MAELHGLFRRQWRRHVGPDEAAPEHLRSLLQAVSDTYFEFDDARRLVERTLALSSVELHATNAELRGVLQALPDTLFRVHPDDRIGDVMPGAPVPDHPVLRHVVDERPADGANATGQFWPAVQQVRDTQASVAFECADGAGDQARFYEVRLLPFVERDIIGIARDITERRRAETALRESQERLALAQRAGHVGAFDWDVHTQRIIWNAESEEIFGLPPGIAGTHRLWADRIVPEDRARLDAFFTAWLRSSRDDEQWEYRIARPDGQQRWIESKGHVFRDAAGQPVRVIGTNLDITARKHAEEDRLVIGKLESTGILAGGIAHDFNNLLTGMLLNLDMARLTPHPDPEFAGYLGEMTQAVAAAKILTDQLITFARGGAGTRRPTRLAALLRESVHLALIGSNVGEKITVPDDLWPAETDSGQLGQVIRNLVLNAREAMPNGGVVSLQAANLVLRPGDKPALPPGDYVRVSVSDQGHGIPPEVLPQIFDPYFSTKQRGLQKGMGLGLTICHSVVLRHGGTIVVESPPDAGATFHVYLPACRAAGAEAPAAPPAARPRSGRILVMDDEQIVRTILKHTLKQIGYDSEAVVDGQAAIDLFARARAEHRPFDAVILDLTVRGGMGGRDAVQALLALDPTARAIVMSGYSNDDILHDYPLHGFKATLVKPFDCDGLRAVLERVLADVPQPA